MTDEPKSSSAFSSAQLAQFWIYRYAVRSVFQLFAQFTPLPRSHKDFVLDCRCESVFHSPANMDCSLPKSTGDPTDFGQERINVCVFLAVVNPTTFSLARSATTSEPALAVMRTAGSLLVLPDVMSLKPDLFPTWT